MSDLQCAASVIVARHGEAEYETEGLSDAGGSLTALGRSQAHALGELLRDRRIAAVWCSDMARAVQTAEIVAAAVGCGVRVRQGLRELGVGDFAGTPDGPDVFADVIARWRAGELETGVPGGETGQEIIGRVSAELEGIADQYRGETTLVVSHGGVMKLVLPALASNLPLGAVWDVSMANCGTVEMAADADGWVVRSWQDQRFD